MMKENNYLIVGLGNPDNIYIYTKHNIGFIFIDNYAEYKNIKIDISKFNGLYNSFYIKNKKIFLLKPQSYMNCSGEVVKKFVDYFKIPIENILIISDDLDLPFNKIRIRTKGSSGGHNGLKSIFVNLKTQNLNRIKFGISKPENKDIKNYVLSNFKSDELEEINGKSKIINDIIEDFINQVDIAKIISKYNGK